MTPKLLSKLENFFLLHLYINTYWRTLLGILGEGLYFTTYTAVSALPTSQGNTSMTFGYAPRKTLEWLIFLDPNELLISLEHFTVYLEKLLEC